MAGYPHPPGRAQADRLLCELVEWAAGQGGFESAIWTRAKRYTDGLRDREAGSISSETARSTAQKPGYLIRSLEEHDAETGDPLFWSNEDGWVGRDSATRFSEEEKRTATRPAGRCVWEPGMAFSCTFMVAAPDLAAAESMVERLCEHVASDPIEISFTELVPEGAVPPGECSHDLIHLDDDDVCRACVDSTNAGAS
jgi:hypothetical protein